MNVKIQTVSALSGLPAVRRKMFTMMFRREGDLPLGPDTDSESFKRMQKDCEQGKALLLTMPEEHIFLRNSRGDRIHGRILINNGITDRFVILNHGYRSSMQEFLGMVPWYMNQPVSILLIDHQAHGESEGSIITFGGQEHLDLLQWARYLALRFGPEVRIMLHGVSMGAATVMLAAGSPDRPPQVKQAVADCGYTSLRDEVISNFKRFHVQEDAWDDISARFSAETGILPEDVSPLEAMKRCAIPLALVHGKEDVFVPFAMCHELHAACPHSTLLEVDGAGHAESWWKNRIACAHVLEQRIAQL